MIIIGRSAISVAATNNIEDLTQFGRALNISIKSNDFSPVYRLSFIIEKNKDPGSISLRAFAAVKRNGSIVTWGHPHHGDNCSAVQEQLAGESKSANGWICDFAMDLGSLDSD